MKTVGRRLGKYKDVKSGLMVIHKLVCTSCRPHIVFAIEIELLSAWNVEKSHF